MPLPLGLAILDFAALMILAYMAKRDDHLTVSVVCDLSAYGCLAWGVIDFVWTLVRG